MLWTFYDASSSNAFMNTKTHVAKNPKTSKKRYIYAIFNTRKSNTQKPAAYLDFKKKYKKQIKRKPLGSWGNNVINWVLIGFFFKLFLSQREYFEHLSQMFHPKLSHFSFRPSFSHD